MPASDEEDAATFASDHLRSAAAQQDFGSRQPEDGYDSQLQIVLDNDCISADAPDGPATLNGSHPEMDAEEDTAFVYTGRDAAASQNPNAEVFLEELEYGPLQSYDGGLAGVFEGLSAERPLDEPIHTATNGMSFKKMHPSGASTPPSTPPISRTTSALTSPARSDVFKTPARKLPRSSSTLSHASGRPSMLASINRLRSSQRFPSTSSINTIRTGIDVHVRSPESSRFDALSRKSSFSSSRDRMARNSGRASSSSSLIDTDPLVSSTNSLRWTPLRQISAKLFHSKSSLTNGLAHLQQNALLGTPTVMAASGLICVGTSKGWVLVFDYAQTLKCVCGSEASGKSTGSVTALALSSDHTFIAAGFSSGAIHLYSLNKPAQPARTVQPVTLSQIQSGRNEGHLPNTRIRHLGFVGARHTAIISSDDRGLAFYHSLGQVLGLANTDIVRISGQYPEAEDDSPMPVPDIVSSADVGQNTLLGNIAKSHQAPRQKQSFLFDISPLPIGPISHFTDSLNLCALATTNKVLIATLKTPAKTWWKALRKDQSEKATQADLVIGSLAWYPAQIVDNKKYDPVLAYSWGQSISIIRLTEAPAGQINETASATHKKPPPKTVQFNQIAQWNLESTALRVLWLNQRILLVQTATHIDLWDSELQTRTGRSSLDIRTLMNPDIAEEDGAIIRQQESSLLAAYNVVAYKGKIFALAPADIRVATVLTWADRIIALVNTGNLLEAIELTALYYQGLANATTLGLPPDDSARHSLVAPKLLEIMHASAEYAFSEARLQDDASNNANGVDRSLLFSGLVDVSIRAGIVLDDLDFTFVDLYERYEENQILPIFLERVGTFVLSQELITLPAHIAQSLVKYFETTAQFDNLAAAVYNLQPECLDINLVLAISKKHSLLDLAIHVYTSALGDWISPLNLCMAKVREALIKEDANHADSDSIVDAGEESVQEVFKIYAVLSSALFGLTYHERKSMQSPQANVARRQALDFILRQGDFNSPLPEMRSLLLLHSEAFLDVLDEGFENAEMDEKGRFSRQAIVDHLYLLRKSLHSQGQYRYDVLMVDIFIARNVPKYPQHLTLPRREISALLSSLILFEDDGDSITSTHEDRQLAVEYLLSVYTPDARDGRLLIELRQAGFFRILRSIYRTQHRYVDFVDACMQDSSLGGSVFGLLEQACRLAAKSSDIRQLQQIENAVFSSALHLTEIDVHATSQLVQNHFPENHANFVSELGSAQDQQFRYLNSLLGSLRDIKLDDSLETLYIRLACHYAPDTIVDFLSRKRGEINQDLMNECNEADIAHAVIWAYDRNNQPSQAMERFDALITDSLDIFGSPDEQDGRAKFFETQLGLAADVAIDICVRRSHRHDAETMWLQLLATLVRLVSFRAKVEIDGDERSQLLSRALIALSGVPNSPRLLFPRLVRSLLDATDIQEKASLSSVRSIFGAMADGYRSEADMLVIAKQLVDQDIFKSVRQLRQERVRGWTTDSGDCPICGRPTYGNQVATADQQSRLDSFNTASDLFEQLVPPTRPKVRRKSSLKGKEVDWPGPGSASTNDGLHAGLRRVAFEDLVVARSGLVFHRACYRAQANQINEA